MNILEYLFGSEDHGQDLASAVGEHLVQLHSGWENSTFKLRGMLGMTYPIDEMALWFRDHGAALHWITEVVQRDGYELYNSAQDEVDTAPLIGRYRVRYWFLRTPFDYRVEVMCVEHGYSPYHTMMAHTDSTVAEAHASFKVDIDEDYANVIRTMNACGCQVMQHCTSAYGKFSYLRDMEAVPDGNNWVLKPRLNLRDAK